MDNGIPVSTYWAFGIGAAASIITILITVITTSEYPPTSEELKEIQSSKGNKNLLIKTFQDIILALRNMPVAMKQLIPVMFFPWFAMFCYWQYLTSALSLSLYGTLDETTSFFNKAQLLTGNLNGTYNIICFSIAFAMIPIAKKIGPKKLHFLA